MNNFLDSRAPLRSSTASAAIIIVRGQYLLQLRDDLPHVWYPGHWGFFGGGMDGSETAEQCLRRELVEELGYAPPSMTYSTQFAFDLSFIGAGIQYRYYYEIVADDLDVEQLKLAEGQDVKLFDGRQALSELRLTPYDSFVLFLHMSRSRIVVV